MLTLETHLLSPDFFTVNSSGLVSALLGVPPAACGRSTWMFTVSKGAATMKMINSTSMTSTIGVTLISAITGLRPLPRRPPPPDELASFMPTVWGSPLGDLTGQHAGKFLREAAEPLGLPVHLGSELIVENRRRNGGNQADRRGKQRLRDTGSHHRQRGIL